MTEKASVKKINGQWVHASGENTVSSTDFSIAMQGEKFDGEPVHIPVEVDSEHPEIVSGEHFDPAVAQMGVNADRLSHGSLVRPERDSSTELDIDPLMAEYIEQNNLHEMVEFNMTHRGRKTVGEVMDSMNKAVEINANHVPNKDEWDEWDGDDELCFDCEQYEDECLCDEYDELAKTYNDYCDEDEELDDDEIDESVIQLTITFD